jgi:hypothetical protein
VRHYIVVGRAQLSAGHGSFESGNRLEGLHRSLVPEKTAARAVERRRYSAARTFVEEYIRGFPMLLKGLECLVSKLGHY